MTRLLTGLLVVALSATTITSCSARQLRAQAEALRQEVNALEVERDRLRARLDEGLRSDPRLAGMPSQPVRVGIPTALLREITSSLVTSVADRVTLELGGLRVQRSGEIHRVITLGEYHLDVLLTRVTARLKADAPTITFGGNRINFVVPVRVLSGSGEAVIDFEWDGRGLSGAVCGDMVVKEKVAGTVAPARYTLRGAVQLTGTRDAIIARPAIPTQRIRVQVSPSRASWATVEELLNSKGGVCGFVLDRVDIAGAINNVLRRGFNVRLPTNRIAPLTLPIGISPSVTMDGQTLVIEVRAVPPAITEHTVWLGADLTVSAAPQRTP